MKTIRFITGVVAIVATVSIVQGQQGGRGGGGAAPQTARAAAPVDLTGTWVSVAQEDWRHRIATPRKGDFESLGPPQGLNAEGIRVANTWDLDKDNAAGLQCKAFGVGGIVRQPGRMRITWQDDNTLKAEFDAGTQTRLIQFSAPVQPSGEKTWQGQSIGLWEGPSVGRGGGRGGAVATRPLSPGGAGAGTRGGPAPTNIINQGGSLKVTTTNFREGYLRKNGVPYSDTASITEYFHRLPSEPGEDSWLVVISVIEDPKYLSQPFYTSTNFKLEADASKFAPTPCVTTPPPPATP
jgi:hypothetical protein